MRSRLVMLVLLALLPSVAPAASPTADTPVGHSARPPWPTRVTVSAFGGIALFGGSVIYVNWSRVVGARIQVDAPTPAHRNAFGLDVDLYAESAWSLIGPAVRVAPMWVTRVQHPGGGVSWFRVGGAIRVSPQWSVNPDYASFIPLVRVGGGACLRPGVTFPPAAPGEPEVSFGWGTCIEFTKWFVDGWAAAALEPDFSFGFTF